MALNIMQIILSYFDGVCSRVSQAWDKVGWCRRGRGGQQWLPWYHARTDVAVGLGLRHCCRTPYRGKKQCNLWFSKLFLHYRFSRRTSTDTHNQIWMKHVENNVHGMHKSMGAFQLFVVRKIKQNISSSMTWLEIMEQENEFCTSDYN